MFNIDFGKYHQGGILGVKHGVKNDRTKHHRCYKYNTISLEELHKIIQMLEPILSTYD